MLVKGIVPRGYCKGVVRAIEIAKKQAHQTTPVYILGMIVHNQYIVNALEDLGIQTIDIKGKTRLELLDEINEGKVIITAHGASQKVFDKAKEKGLEVIDASCLDVIKTHDLIQDKLNEGYEILYIGKKGHPEAEGAISIDEKRSTDRTLVKHRGWYERFLKNSPLFTKNIQDITIDDGYE